MSTHEHEKKDLISTPVAILLGSLIIALGLFAGLMFSDRRSSNTGNTQDKWANAVKAVDINKKKFDQCLASGKYAAKVTNDLQSGQGAGVSGTPSSFVIAPNGTQYRIAGAQPVDVVKALIEKALRGEPSTDAQVTLPPITEQDYILGDKNATITIVEYSDLECPFCVRFHATQEAIMEEYAGQVRWVHRHFPLDFHKNAKEYAYAAECAGEIGGNDAFWNMIDYIFKNQPLS